MWKQPTNQPEKKEEKKEVHFWVTNVSELLDFYMENQMLHVNILSLMQVGLQIEHKQCNNYDVYINQLNKKLRQINKVFNREKLIMCTTEQLLPVNFDPGSTFPQLFNIDNT